jgi:acyl-CoA thioesterase
MAKRFSANTAGFNPFADLIGLEFTQIGEGASRCELEADERHFNPHGVLHGGVVYSMADTGMGGALYTVLGEGELCATVEIKISYFKAVRSGRLFCDTRIINKGKRVASLESEIRNNHELVAKATGTYAII